MPAGSTTGGQRHLGGTMRRDAWWLELLPVIVLLGAFGIYATLRAFEGILLRMGAVSFSLLFASDRPPSSVVAVLSGAVDFDLAFGIPGHVLLLSKGLLSRFFSWIRPLAPSARAANTRYRGETGFPLILQNLHRYFLYVGFIFLIFLWRDAFRAFFFNGRIGVGVGTLVLLVNVILLTTYALSCHSLRHLVGGKLDCFSCVAFGGPRHTAGAG